MRTRAKICGLSREEDVAAAVEAGADAIGLVFYEPSPRNISVERACALTQQIPAFVSIVGLFVNADKGVIEDIIQKVRIDLLQFHGDEPEAFCAQFSRPYIKALRVADDTNIAAIADDYSSARGLLLDTYRAGIPGGTGEVFNWELIPRKVSLPIILAGGLTASNVAAAIQKVQPYAVDVSGGVERDKGIKDINKIRAFMNEVQGVGRN